MRTLILDDDPVYRAVAEDTLRSLAIDDIEARAEGAGALDAISSADPPYELVLLDLNMPGFDGLTFLRALADIRFTGAIVLVSAEKQTVLSSASHIASKHGLKIFGALNKPMQLADMRAALERVRTDLPTGRSEFKVAHDIKPASIQPMLHYQPQIDIRDRSIAGAEALLRCSTHEGLILGPETLLKNYATVAQRLELTARLFDILCADLKTLENRIGWSSNIAFNIDAHVLESADLLPAIIAAVKNHGVDPGRITIELTESQLPRDSTRLLEVIARLGMVGFEMSLDDFGTGASNFDLLREGAFNEVKLDKSIVHAAAHEDSVSQKFLHIVADIAQAMNTRVVAEGIEEERDLAFMEKLGIVIAQGYYFSKPASLDEFIGKMTTGERRMRLAS